MRAVSILGAVALIAGCSDQGATGAANNQAQARPGEKEARIGSVALHYNSTRLVTAPVQVDLPPDNRRQVRGMKLIAKEREPFLHTARCPGQEGNICLAEA